MKFTLIYIYIYIISYMVIFIIYILDMKVILDRYWIGLIPYILDMIYDMIYIYIYIYIYSIGSMYAIYGNMDPINIPPLC